MESSTYMTIQKLLTFEQALPYLGLRKSKIYLEIAAGRLQATKIGRSTFLKESEIVRYIEANAKPLGTGEAIEGASNQPHTA
jgi:excisionase family DNA binding protein